MSNIHKSLNKIRRLINIPRKIQEIRAEPNNWYMLCNALDVLRDTADAITAYRQLEIDPNKDKERLYLYVYGLMQALYVQQDAAKYLYGSLSFGYGKDKTLEKIRRIRNISAGHPISTNKERAFNFISSSTLTKERFKIFSIAFPSKSNAKQATAQSNEKKRRHQITPYI